MFARFKQIFRPHRDIWKILSFAINNWSNRYTGYMTQRRVAALAIVKIAACKAAINVNNNTDNKFQKKRIFSKDKYIMSLEGKAQHYLNALKVRWQHLQEVPGLFAYQLAKSRPNRILPGQYKFYTELNTDRTLKRRQPQTIETLSPKFKPKQFNFNKVDDLEVLMTIDNEQDMGSVQMIINKSPLSKYHTLICPDVKSNLVQRITPQALRFCITFLRNIDDDTMRMGYNSPGALASVNHLHFHLIHMPQKLYIDNVKLENLAGSYLYRTTQEMPIQALCVIIASNDNDEAILEKVNNVYKLTEWMCQKNIPHNLFVTQNRSPGKQGNLHIFIFARSTYCVNKDVTAFNVGFCELAGFIPLGNEEKMRNLSETVVVQRVQEITGNAMDSVYEQAKHIVNGTNSTWQLPFIN
ncbi:GDP-D-glucose phosphorylase 1 [Drosophila tropicalis]|uniref:GDP-D-glucose phosphorylase 1 n=1 Tax=Drosophila tropicalis TaxID=46794 RepID=UPI0035AB82AC